MRWQRYEVFGIYPVIGRQTIGHTLTRWGAARSCRSLERFSGGLIRYYWLSEYRDRVGVSR